MIHSTRVAAALVLLALVGAACSEGSGDDDTTSAGTDAATDTTTAASADSVVAQFAGEEWFMGTVPATPVAADEDAEPIRIGIINQENSPAGSFPEVRAAAEATVAFINAELGGVDGRPLELLTCAADFAPETSQACAQDLVNQGVIAFLGGLDVGSTGSIPVLEQNEIPVVGGIPVNLADMRSPIAFYFSGGTPGAFSAFAAYAIRELGAERIAVAYGEFESFEHSATTWGADVATELGAEVELIPFPILGTDFLPVLTKAADFDADAIIVGAADTACVPLMETRRDLEIEATLLLVGACAAPEILDQAGAAAEGVIFNSEGPFDENREAEIFAAATERYATEPAGGAGTVSFRGAMNLWAALTEVAQDEGSDAITSAAILEYMRATRDQPSFWGHPYTCDGKQMSDLIALCAPQQYLFEIGPEGTPAAAPNGFVDVTEFADSE